MAPFQTALSFLYYDNTARERHSVYVISSILVNVPDELAGFASAGLELVC